MKRGWGLAPILGLALGTLVPAQQPPAAADAGPKPGPNSPDERFVIRLAILSEANAGDVCSYLEGISAAVRKNWLKLIPPQARGRRTQTDKYSIDFEIVRDGRVEGMRFAGPSGDHALAQAAWDSVRDSSPFSPLPSEIGGPDLTLRIRFSYTADDAEAKPGDRGIAGCSDSGVAESEVLNVGDGVTPPVAIYSPQPKYPQEARLANKQGEITLAVVVDDKGHVQSAEITKGLSPELDKRALEAVRSWRFKPAIKNGKPVSVRVDIHVAFRLY